MGDYYHHFLSSMAGVGGQPIQSPLEGPPQMPHQPQMLAMGGPPMPNPYQSLGYFTGFPEPIMFNAPKSQRSRRKSAPGLDHIKHRRTRSGCFTCRGRRVKCDETHPICERCRKGKRDCLYPEPAPPKGSGGSASKESSAAPSQQASPSSSRGDDDDDDDDGDSKLEPIMDEDEEEPQSATSTTAPMFPLRRSSTTSSFGLQRVPPGYRHGSETPSFDGNKSSSPSLSTGTATAQSHRPDWSFLPHELQFYLSYFYDNITNFHYGLVTDAGDFFRTTLIGLALRNEALLYAVAAFSAYHHALKNPHGRINEFLQYYNYSVQRLLDCLKKKEKYNIATLLTILQLGTIEEYLGDWVNLMGHQKAALEIFTQLFTPQTVMQSQLGRAAFMWYARFDLFVAIMGSFETTLPREWYLESTIYHNSSVATEPDNISYKFEACSAKLQLTSMEMALLYAKKAQGEVTGEEYSTEHQRLTRSLDDWKAGWDPVLTDPSYLVTDFSGSRTPDPNDIINPFTSGALFRPPMFASTILTVNYHSMSLLHRGQSGIRPTEQAREEMTEHAYRIYQIFEAVEFWRKFVLLEAMGYIFPATMRARMAELFSDDTCTRWWLPNDEDFPSLLQNIRAYADERNVMAASTQRDTVQQIRHVFSRMDIGHASGEGTQN
ncbi:hypothetical protein B0T21DRAFT_384528 [Apiosordaria backusii]|uniref:Zn(2)-C6 fungal-type domain-containing protein n=1 Tax=Apiosordaria backusii TaxID=314023 RepID=A0AA40BK76_9PEZI|nr:hypothetical protein B0T21DRAFT_384528 [Apiosordaria backusii]